MFIYRVIIIALFTPIINIQNVFSTLSHHNTANCSACCGDYNYYLDRSNVQTEYQSNLIFVTILMCLRTIQCRKKDFTYVIKKKIPVHHIIIKSNQELFIHTYRTSSWCISEQSVKKYLQTTIVDIMHSIYT